MNGDEFAGSLRERVTIERRGGERDAEGGASGAWAPVATVFAGLAPAGTTDVEIGEALDARPLWRVTLRPADARVGDRLAWRARRLAVRGLVADPRTPDRIELQCEEQRR